VLPAQYKLKDKDSVLGIEKCHDDVRRVAFDGGFADEHQVVEQQNIVGRSVQHGRESLDRTRRHLIARRGEREALLDPARLRLGRETLKLQRDNLVGLKLRRRLDQILGFRRLDYAWCKFRWTSQPGERRLCPQSHHERQDKEHEQRNPQAASAGRLDINFAARHGEKIVSVRGTHSWPDYAAGGRIVNNAFQPIGYAGPSQLD
jgi:hypothetical protein